MMEKGSYIKGKSRKGGNWSFLDFPLNYSILMLVFDSRIMNYIK